MRGAEGAAERFGRRDGLGRRGHRRGRRRRSGLGDGGHRRFGRPGADAWSWPARAGSVVALANKESLPLGLRGPGAGQQRAAREAGGTVILVDLEHSAIFQVLQPACAERVSRLILTASGGPFRSWTLQAMSGATPEQAVAHPNWSYGLHKISIDSATMMNKGLEMIEASYLFATPEAKIEVLVHPQSIVCTARSSMRIADPPWPSSWPCRTCARPSPARSRGPIGCPGWRPRLDLGRTGQPDLRAAGPGAVSGPARSPARCSASAASRPTASMRPPRPPSPPSLTAGSAFWDYCGRGVRDPGADDCAGGLGCRRMGRRAGDRLAGRLNMKCTGRDRRRGRDWHRLN